MRIILQSAKGNIERRFAASPAILAIAVMLLGGFLWLAGAWFGYLRGADEAIGQGEQGYKDLQVLLQEQRGEIDRIRLESQRYVDDLALKFGRLQARVTRMDSLAQELVSQAGLEKTLAYDDEPALGGIESSLAGGEVAAAELLQDLSRLEMVLTDRAWKLDLLEALLVDRRLKIDMLPAGKPIERGVITSGFGKRRDPFKGNRSFHRGIDFQARPGTKIMAVASGVVRYSGARGGYGNLVEIQHANGLMTRYAHNKRNLVEEGEPVLKGQTIALLGSSGRSSGPHVHFEVVRDGVALNPIKYIKNNK